MTGFARAAGDALGLGWIWEIKSVNGRALDVKLRMPLGFETLDQSVREACAQRFKRGSLQINLSLQKAEGAAASVRVDLALARALIDAGEALVAEGLVEKPRWDGLLQVRGVVVSDDAEVMNVEAREALEAALLSSFRLALDDLDAARRREGRMLSDTLVGHAERLDALISAAKSSAAAAPAALQERLRQRLAALAGDLALDPQRLAQEAALIVARADVQEELDRLGAHGRELRTLIGAREPAGRRLDFLTQELTREANTLCSKASELELTRIGLDLKAVIDQIKEQAANVE